MSTDPPEPALAAKEEEETSLASADSSREAEDDAPKANTSAPVSEGRDTRARRASATTPASARRTRRKKDDDDKKAEPGKESKPRSRRPREKSTVTTSGSSARKKPKLEHPSDQQPTSTDLVPPAAPAPDAQPSPSPRPELTQRGNHEAIPDRPPSASTPAPTAAAAAAAAAAAPTLDSSSYPMAQPPLQPQPPLPPQRSSGQNYDPIRSAFDNPSPAPPPAMTPTPSQTPAVPSHSPFSPPAHTMSPGTAFRASASPAISSIIDPPAPPASVQQASHSIYPQVSKTSPMQKPATVPSPRAAHVLSAPSSVAVSSPNLAQPQQDQHQQQQQQQPPPPPPPAQHSYESQLQQQQPSRPVSQLQEAPLLQQPVSVDVEMNDTIQSNASKSTGPSKKEKGTSSGLPSNAHSPKPTRVTKDAPPPLPQGSGLISGALFGVDGGAAASGSLKTAPNIILHIPLRGQSNKVINFARMAEEQYGFAALHPRLAAQRERLARVAAASAALEKTEKGAKGISAGESAEEDLSMDAEPDSDLDADVSMEMGVGLTAGGNTAGSEASLGMTADGKKKRTRKKKIEDYDRDDPFVDDSELAWQEHAAASKDGFFVYSGPLVPEGEKIQVERADGTIRRGRGRGRGSGRGRGTSHHQPPLASAIPISQETGLPVRGPGSRGGTTTRKPRITKAARLQMEQEKQERERMGHAVSHEGRGRGGYSRGGGPSNRGGRGSSNITAGMVGLAPAPAPGIAPGPPPAFPPGQGIIMR
ncbi:hypothetical protein NFIA_071320 [Paecilomyces variotii No. 5]|uniref:Hpc2-related domain-containing protein n=1 Tax=Byssochlamys spectabilis (strain No. 5 / NBRC 109023) TaxID=1356009 RepID=V5FUA3_BYSSN|nr:hypothetical protein NFIA_071320 [Paecilomyces variotii No. 5]